MTGDNPEIGNVGTVDEERARQCVVQRCRRRVAVPRSHELSGLECKARIDVPARRVDREADSFRKGA